jgi:SAM-dependent methyltransferase
MDAARLLVCPGCDNVGLERGSRALSCPSCSSRYPDQGNYFDLFDAAHGEPTAATAEQRLMESELVARLYDRLFRPAFVRLLGGSGAGHNAGGFEGELFIYKNALATDDREGPWLDLSCGTGSVTRALAAAAPGDWVIGADISRAMLEAAGRRNRGYGNVVLIRADAHDLPIEQRSLGGACVASALHVYDDPERVFNEILRTLRRGGIFVGSAFHKKAATPFHRLAGRLGGIRRFDPYELRTWLSRVGFVDYEEIRLGSAFIFRVRRP